MRAYRSSEASAARPSKSTMFDGVEPLRGELVKKVVMGWAM